MLGNVAELAGAILERAILDFAGTDKRCTRAEHREALDWLRDEGEHAFGFAWCCTLNGLAPQATRERILRAYAAGAPARKELARRLVQRQVRHEGVWHALEEV